MTPTALSKLPRTGPLYGLIVLLIPCAIALSLDVVYGFAPPGHGLQRIPLVLALLTLITIAGLWLQKPGALWLTLIVVSFYATLAVFFWSISFHRILVAASVVVLCVVSVLTFWLGPTLGRSVGLYQRMLFGFVLSFASWVAYWGLFRPIDVARAIPFTVPPLHARFLGAMYLSGAIFMLLGMLGRQWHQVRVVTLTLAVWTGMLGIVSLFHLEAFNWSREQVWFWFVAYICFPLVALWVAWCQRSDNDSSSGPELAARLRSYLYAQGTVAVVLGIALLCAPRFMTTLWPWKIPLIVAHIYGAPFLSFGVGSLYAARQRAWSEVRILILGTLVFAIGVLIASRIHVKLFNFRTPSAWIWFGGFGFTSIALLLFSGLSWSRTRT